MKEDFDIYKDLLSGDIIKRIGEDVETRLGSMRTGDICVFKEYRGGDILIEGYEDLHFYPYRFEFVGRPNKISFELDDSMFIID